MAMFGFPEIARELGADPAQILNNHGLPSDYFKAIKVDDLMTMQDAEQLMETLADKTKAHHCGALMGSRQDIGFLGIIGYIMQQSSTVLLALDALHEHLTLHHEKGQTGVASYGDVSGLYWNNPLPFEEQHYTNEAAMAQAAVVLRAIIGNQFRAKAVHFTHRAPADIKPYKQIFKAPVYFNQAKNEIIFDSILLKKKIIKADPLLREILVAKIEKHHPHKDNDLLSEVEVLIRQSLQGQQYQIEVIAKHLSLHPRTLQRKLQDLGISYSGLLEKIRRNIAQERLANANISITQLSDYLGYADNTALTRAFKRWFGITPTEWKKKYKT
jgi:AraC-like DNA-binding protein